MSSHKTNKISILAPLNATGKKTPTHKISPLNQQNVKYLFSTIYTPYGYFDNKLSRQQKNFLLKFSTGVYLLAQ
jgi:hypothetical protein